jgi:AcrR family transcriptional regulator
MSSIAFPGARETDAVRTPRRSDATRAAILVAARERFAADGYERATIRAIAADAHIDPAMVMRYYGSKDQLFAAAAAFELRLPDLGAVAAEDVGRTLVEHFVHRWEGDDTLVALLRASLTNAVAAGRMQEIFDQQVRQVAATVEADPAMAATRAGLVAAQMLGLALSRYVLRLPPIVALTPADVVEWLGPTIQRYLTV